MDNIETEEIATSNLQVGDNVLCWGNKWRKCVSVSSHFPITEYQLEGVPEPHRHSGQVRQTIQKR